MSVTWWCHKKTLVLECCSYSELYSSGTWFLIKVLLFVLELSGHNSEMCWIRHSLWKAWRMWSSWRPASSWRLSGLPAVPGILRRFTFFLQQSTQLPTVLWSMLLFSANIKNALSVGLHSSGCPSPGLRSNRTCLGACPQLIRNRWDSLLPEAASRRALF